MRTRLVGAATAAVLAAGALATTSVLGSSHREAPRIMLDPAADNTDVYAFVAPDAPRQLTVVSNWVPLVSPAGGPYFGKLDPEAHYYVKIDNTGDGVEDVAYRWRFKNRFRNPDSFLYAIPPVNSFNDPQPQLRPDLRPGLHPLPRRQADLRSHDRAQPPGRARQRRAEDVPELRERRRRHHPQPPQRRQDVRRPGRRPVLHRPRHRLRRHQHRQARPADDRPRQPGRRQGRRLGLQRALVRAAGAVRGRHPRRERRQGPERRPIPASASGRPPSASR